MLTTRELFDFSGFFMEEVFARAEWPWEILSQIKHTSKSYRIKVPYEERFE